MSENANKPGAKLTPDELAKAAVESSRALAQKLPLLGHVTWLYTQSQQHKHYFIQDIESRVLPAIVTDQCKIYLQESATQLPLGYVSWAYLSEQAEERHIATQRIAPGDWKSGDRVWIIDFVVPFGGAAEALDDIRNKIHPGKEVHLLYPGADGKVGKTTLSELAGGSQKKDEESNESSSENSDNSEEPPVTH